MKIDSIAKMILKATFCLILLANAGYGGATLTVNWIGPGEACDNNLTLAEAAHLGRGGFGRALTNAERNQISGGNFVAAPLPPECAGTGWLVVNGLGPNDADDIVFVGGITVPINYGINLGKNDDIDGNSSGVKVILDGSSQPPGTRGIDIELDSGSQVRNLVIRNFPSSGIFAQRMNGAKFEGLDIFGNSGAGISLGFNGNVNSRNVTIGGDQPQHRNRIFSNGSDGIAIVADPAHDRFPEEGIFILNNLIGTSDGVTDNGNGGRGITLQNAFGVYVGDLTGATHNIISGNNNDGIAIEGAGAISNRIIANYIGTTESSNAPLGNSASGIALLNDAGSTADFISTGPNYIGQAGLGNVISANNFGIFIADPNTSLNRIQGNLIGTNVGGTTDLGNAADGIYFVNGTFDNIIGGVNSGEGNLIGFNRNGIRADSGVRNVFRRNRIFSNDLLGIELAPVGVTPNDAGDIDVGPNNLQNFPVITFVNASPSSVNIQGTFNGAANQTFTLEFFGNSGVDASGFGEGRNFLGTTNVTTNASGNATFNATFTVAISTVGSWVTATATDANNNTSEYSQARNICSDLRLSPDSILAPLGGISTSFTYLTAPGCAVPTAVSNSAWITVGGVGSGSVFFTVAANTGPPRDGLINVNYNNGTGTTTIGFLVSQNNGCTYSINPTSLNISGQGGNSTVNAVASNSGCTWGATSNAAWLTINGGSTGTGSGPVSFTVAANPGAARSGTLSVAGQTFTVNQGSACTFSISPTSLSINGDGGTGTVTVTASNASCTWAATSNVNWITVTSGGTGSGSGTVGYSVSQNLGSARSGTMTIAGQTFTVNQGASCNVQASPSSINPGPLGEGGTISITTGAGCNWTATTTQTWIMITGGSGSGSGTFAYTIAANTSAPRIGQINLPRGQFVTVNQGGASCFTTLSAAGASIGGGGGSGSFGVNANCGWQSVSNAAWITITGGATGPSGSGTISYSVQRNTGGARSGTITVNASNTFTVTQSAGRAKFDFDGDLKADVSVFRPSDGSWWYVRSSDNQNRVYSFGQATDKLVPADYTGDGKTDIAIFRPSDNTWYVQRSEDGSYFSIPFGAAGDIPCPGDFDRDGKADIAVFRPSTGTWYITYAVGGNAIISFGVSGDVPVVEDYDGDGKADIAVFRPSGGSWWILRSSTGVTFSTTFGNSLDKPVPADYTGDGRADIAIWRPADGNWYVLRSEDFSYFSAPFGSTGDIPVAGDYDGDGRSDFGVFRPSGLTWYLSRTTAGTGIFTFGAPGDKPVPAAFVP